MAVRVGASTLIVPTSVSAGAACDVRAMEAKSFSIEGAFSATYQPQISCDPSDSPAANSWINVGSALTTAGQVFVQQPCCYLRLNCTAYTSGTPIGRVAGMTSFT